MPSILIADDDRDIREMYRACFDLSGFRTAEAGTGQEAVRLAERLRPDVLLTDLVLPDIDGLAVARRIRAQVETAGVRIILMTGFDLDGFQRRAAEAGICRAVLKPCLPDAMLREVRRALRRLPSS